ncbi:MAG: hypothetical protein EOM35_09455 [Negativicutes bacterium]|nr:hypothetical protein [Negativicutes bacterium]
MKKEQATTKTKGSRAKSILIGLLSIGAAQLLVAAITGNPPGNVKTTETTYPRMRTQFNDTPRAYTKEEYVEKITPKLNGDQAMICAYEITIDQYGTAEMLEMDRRTTKDPNDIDQRFADNYYNCLGNQ